MPSIEHAVRGILLMATRPATPDEEWIGRAVQLANGLAHAADELRRLVDEVNRTRGEPGDDEHDRP